MIRIGYVLAGVGKTQDAMASYKQGIEFWRQSCPIALATTCSNPTWLSVIII